MALPVALTIVGYGNLFLVRWFPNTVDSQLLAVDHGWSALLRSWILTLPLLAAALDVCYRIIPLAMGVAFASADSKGRVRIALSLFISTLLAIPCYKLVPAVGPAHIGQAYAARNCMPSLHLAWALLLWLHTSPRWLKRSAFAFVWLTALATISTGEHYLIDLVAAVPFAFLVYWLSSTAAALFEQKHPVPHSPAIISDSRFLAARLLVPSR